MIRSNLAGCALVSLALVLAASCDPTGENGDNSQDQHDGGGQPDSGPAVVDAGVDAGQTAQDAGRDPVDGGDRVDGGQRDGGHVNTDAGIKLDGGVGPDGGISAKMSFFVTSRGGGKGGDFRQTPSDTNGLAGADALCQTLAAAVSPVLGAKTWRAYLSTGTENARDRIGTGPWFNARGLQIADSIAGLHEEGGKKNAINYDNALDEKGNKVPGVVSNPGAYLHDILTGSTTAGRTQTNGHCKNWTSDAAADTARIGHSDRVGGGSTSWNSVHNSGCRESGTSSVRSGGGRGSIYCFAL